MKDKIFAELEKLYPNADTELVFANEYELLIAVMLSAQCTDARVNIVTKKLFSDYNTPQKMVTLSQEELEKKIFSCGFYKNKAENILKTSRILVEKYNGKLPHTIEELVELPGVGRKTANVVAAIAFGVPAIAVDTHVFRVANRIGLAHADDVLKTELQLMERIPRDYWLRAHHLLLWHGRRVCSARKPNCMECAISRFCEKNQS